MASTVTVRGEGGIDARDFKAAARALRRASPILARDLRRNLRAAGELVAQDARKIAGEYSASIPPTIKVRTSGASVSVVAGGAQQRAALARQMFNAPHGTKGADREMKRLEREAQGVVIAGLFELGNTGGRKSARASRSGRFRHPVYGNRGRWVNQPMHPFLAPAGEHQRPAVDALVHKALDEATRIIAFED